MKISRTLKRLFKFHIKVVLYRSKDIHLHTRIILNSQLPDAWSSKNFIFKVDEAQVFFWYILLIVILFPVQAIRQWTIGVLQQPIKTWINEFMNGLYSAHIRCLMALAYTYENEIGCQLMKVPQAATISLLLISSPYPTSLMNNVWYWVWSQLGFVMSSIVLLRPHRRRDCQF